MSKDIMTGAKDKVNSAKWECIGWLITREDGSNEAVIGTLTDDTYLSEGDTAVPMAIHPLKDKQA